jgi:hypothetical protein
LKLKEEGIKALINFTRNDLAKKNKYVKFLLKKLPADQTAKAIIKIIATPRSSCLVANIFSPNFLAT